MASKTIHLLLRATPPPALPSRLSSLRRRKFPLLTVATKRFYASKSSLEPPDVPRLAKTARISLTSQEVPSHFASAVEDFAPKIRQVVDWFGQLQAVDLQSVEPALRADTEGDNLRDDAPEIFNNRGAIIASVPTYEDSYVKVPKVLNKE